jgi:hypothetical protein
MHASHNSTNSFYIHCTRFTKATVIYMNTKQFHILPDSMSVAVTLSSFRSHDSSVKYSEQAAWHMNHYSLGRGIRLLSSVSRPAIDPIRLPMQWVPEALYPGVKQLGCKVITYLHSVPMFTPQTDLVPIVQEAGWTSGSLYIDAENSAPTTIWSPDSPACSKWSVLEYLVRRLGKSILTHIILACNRLSLSYPSNSHYAVSV